MVMPYFEDMKPGDELPPLVKGPVTRQMLVEWCAAENDYYALHYDERVAQAMKLPGTPIQGTFRYAMMGQMVEHWLDGNGTLRRITAAYRGLNLEGDTITARGKVTACNGVEDGSCTVDIEVWVENDKGERSTIGQATVLLPRRT
jgi:acyl dehydratase